MLRRLLSVVQAGPFDPVPSIRREPSIQLPLLRWLIHRLHSHVVSERVQQCRCEQGVEEHEDIILTNEIQQSCFLLVFR